jgi:hypothetical protein
MNMLSKSINLAGLLLAALLAMLVPALAMATPTGPDFSSILSGIDVDTVVTAILAACALIAIVGFAKWGGKKLARFFG